MATDILFSDIDFNFTRNPLSGDVSRKTNEEAIKQSLKNIILTMYYERPFNSSIGSQVKQLMFEPITPLLNILIQKHIEQAITNFEPRVDLDKINVAFREEQNSVDIKIYYTILNSSALQTFDLILERTR